MSRSIDSLIVGKVIGDVVDMFFPTVIFTVHYGSKLVDNGCVIKPSATADRPRVQIRDASLISDILYTLVMVDPDAPNPSNPTMREWLLWAVVDIPEGSDAATRGKEMVPYMGPQPTVGVHRFVLALFQQNGPMVLGNEPIPYARPNFCTRDFAAQNRMGIPVAAVFFYAQREPSSKKRLFSGTS